MNLLRKALGWLLIALIAFTPVLGFVAPRLLVWYLIPLALVSLLCGEKGKQPLWLAACVPLWAGFLGLISVIWAAYPYDSFELLYDRLPQLYGLSLCVIGLSRVSNDIWRKALVGFAWLSAFMVLGIAAEIANNYPLNRWYFHYAGVQDTRWVLVAILNRSLTAALFFAVPALWVLWRKQHYLIAALYAAGLLTALSVNEAFAATVAALCAIIVFCAALYQSQLLQKLFAAGGAFALIAAPWILPYVFAYRPSWNAIDAPSTGGRLEIWNFVSHFVQQRPLTGYGYEASRYMVFPTDFIYYKYSQILHPHNAGLQVWMEFGALGVALAVIGWLCIVRNIKTPMGFAWLAMIAVMGSLSFGMWQGAWLTLLVLSALYWRAAATSFGNNSQ